MLKSGIIIKWAKKNNIQGYSSSIDECEEDET